VAQVVDCATVIRDILLSGTGVEEEGEVVLPPDCPKCGGRRVMEAVVPYVPPWGGFVVVGGRAYCPKCEPPGPPVERRDLVRGK